MSKIKYLDDIVDEMTEELGRDRREIEEICKLNIKYIHKLIRDPEVISIMLPGLGTLHFNERKAKGTYKNSATYKYFKEIIGSQIDIVNDVHQDNKDLVHKRQSYFSAMKKYFFKNREERKRVSKSEVFKKIETKQNKVNK